MSLNSTKISKAVIKLDRKYPDANKKIAEALVDFLVLKKSINLLPKIIEKIERENIIFQEKTNFRLIAKNDPSPELVNKLKKFLNVPAEKNATIEKNNEIEGGIVTTFNFKEIDQSFSHINYKLQKHLTD